MMMTIIGVIIVIVGIFSIDYVTPTVAKATQFLEDRGYQVLSAVLAMDVSDIKVKTDNLPLSPANEATSLLIKAKTDLIVSGGATQATLLDVADEAEYIEEHMHHKVIWYGKNADQTTYWASANTLTPFRATSGANAYGTAGTDPAKCFSTSDNLSELGTGLVSGDFDEVLFVGNSSSTVYKLRLIWGTGTVAEAVTAGQLSETMFYRDNADKSRQPRLWSTPKIGVENAIWVECWNASDDATIDFFVGAHAYDF
jgi:hypothetical protein